ncbi:type I-B CRISPR-associated endonuclease Cas1b [Rubeoparvulum massiliense]|uniref:type I-B CRISPR-associated endonuclease Cas1b n=1 Tax=Rubeoparvulum massiliense TaxID=1631346 RepID=UPI00065E19CE|nr:type I-B CRISPR-associated endonuclease Cas1b [Rubeoparvulum massiliense]
MKKTLYFFNNGELVRQDNTIRFETNEGKRVLPIEDINDIYIFGEVNMTKKFLELMSQKEVCIHFYNYYGYYTGTFYPREHLNSGHVILKQAETYLDDQRRLHLARKFVEGSIIQMTQVLKYYQSRVKQDREQVKETIQSLQSIQERLKEWDTINDLMALEGNARESYYAMFDPILNFNPDFIFEKRSRRPPLNRLNAMISFGNSICYTIVLSEIYKTYLDPRIGFLHATNFRRFSLNLDVAEIFKPLLVDRLIFTLINKRMLTKKDFDGHLEGIILSESGRRKFIQEFDQRLKTTIQHRQLGRAISYRRLIRLELYKVQKQILGEKEYQPYSSRW